MALVLHTSGTTARPKIVPLRQVNVAASAQISPLCSLWRQTTTCLNVMPLFHIHGLIAAVLSSLSAGGAVICTPGFNAFKFFSWFDAVNPSWYTAVPTMHQAILGMAARRPAGATMGRLRFVRSSSASLPPQVMTEMEQVFGVPVIEAYGMTEAAHQMASNPLPPSARFAGSVGIAAGPEIAIMDEDGKILAADDIGEVVIKGRNVTAAMRTIPTPTPSPSPMAGFAPAIRASWMPMANLRLTGRLKELINRGGEKVSPLEVDTVLMDHPAVTQVVTFAMPHDKLGEEVRGSRRLERRRDVDRTGVAGLRGRASGAVQGAAQDRVPG